MDDWGIGDTARHFHVSASTLRYYEDRRLISPRRLPSGERRYDDDQLRRIAFLRLGAELGVSLQVVVAVLDEHRSDWQADLDRERARLSELIRTAQTAEALLEATIRCPHQRPGAQCPDLKSDLDALVAGTSVDELAARYDSSVTESSTVPQRR